MSDQTPPPPPRRKIAGEAAAPTQPARKAPVPRKRPAAKNATTPDEAPAATEPAAKKSAAKKAPAEKTAAKKATAKKSTAQKAPAKKTPAQKTAAQNTAAKKTAAKKAPAKKSAAQKAPAAKKASPAKTAAAAAATDVTTDQTAEASRAPVKKAPAKKAPAKRAPAPKKAVTESAAAGTVSATPDSSTSSTIADTTTPTTPTPESRAPATKNPATKTPATNTPASKARGAKTGTTESRLSPMPGPRRATVVTAVAGLVLVAGAVIGWFGLQHFLGESTQDSRAEAVSTASNAAETIFSFSFDDLDAHTADSKALMTPDYAEQFDQIAPALTDIAPEREVVVEAVTRNAAVLPCGDECSANEASVLVFVDLDRRTQDDDASTVFGNRIVVDLVRSDGDWKVGDIRAL